MCRILKISRSCYYKYQEPETKKDEYTGLICKIFKENQRAYGTRRIKKECQRQGVTISRRRIARIMRSEALASSYTVAKYKVSKSKANNDLVSNHIDRQFNDRIKHEVIVSDLTYVRVGLNWNYICTLVDLHNREIVGYSCGPYKMRSLFIKHSLESKLTSLILNTSTQIEAMNLRIH